MIHDGYEISLYCSDLKLPVLSLLRHLWGEDHNSNLRYFAWKYDDNPCTDDPSGIVALYKGEVVGFKGYFATKWQLCDSRYQLTVFSSGDTCVHPGHRRKGLSVAMGNLAKEKYASKSRVFLNPGVSKRSLPGNLKMGYVPIMDKTYATKSSVVGLIKYVLVIREKAELSAGKISFGKFNDILVTDTPRPEEMHAVFSMQRPSGRKFTLLKEEEFFRWRFNNNRKKYAFYFRIEDGFTTGYVVISITPNNRRGYILDCAGHNWATIERLLRYITSMKHFDILSILNLGLNESLLSILSDLGFKTNNLTGLLERMVRGKMPLLVQPTGKKYVEGDRIIEGLDIRKIESWEISEICSDYA